MAARQTEMSTPISKKIRRLGIGVAIVVALYSAGWFFVASKFEAYLGQFIQSSPDRGIALRCDGLKTGGFPFLIGFSCDRSAVAAQRSGDEAEAGAVKVAARIYNPGLVVSELDGPAVIRLGDGSDIQARWTSLRASAHAGLDGLSQISLVSKAPSADMTIAALFQRFALKAGEAELHLRARENDLDAAMLLRDFQWQEADQAAPIDAVSASAELTLDQQAGLLAGRTPDSKAMSGKLANFKIEMAGGLYGELSGPFTLDEDGYLSGDFTARLERLDLWEQNLLLLFPDAQSTVSGMATLLKGLAKGGDKVTVTLSVNEGLITLSMMPLGHIPPL